MHITRHLYTVRLMASMAATVVRGDTTLTFDTETTDIIVEAKQRWARQNHAAAEGHAIPISDYELTNTGEVNV